MWEKEDAQSSHEVWNRLIQATYIAQDELE